MAGWGRQLACGVIQHHYHGAPEGKGEAKPGHEPGWGSSKDTWKKKWSAEDWAKWNEEKADQNEASEMKQLANTSEMEQMAEELQEAAKACGLQMRQVEVASMKDYCCKQLGEMQAMH